MATESSTKVTWPFKQVRATKNTFRFEPEDVEGEESPFRSPLYLDKSAFGKRSPARIFITASEEEEKE